MVVKDMVHFFEQRHREASQALDKRAERMKPDGAPLKLSPLEHSIHFLRGVGSRASLCIPAFHFFVGSQAAQSDPSIKENYPLAVSASYMGFASLNTLSLSCRKAFDHATCGLTGCHFSKARDDLLKEHAQYWADNSGNSAEDAALALKLLRDFFRCCSKHENELLRASSMLEKRIGLLKQHANRSAAHLSLENYEIHLSDVAHFATAICVVGEIIRIFDSPDMGEKYYEGVEIGAHEAAKQTFPMLNAPRLFEGIDVGQLARKCWRSPDDGLRMLLDRLPAVTGWN